MKTILLIFILLFISFPTVVFSEDELSKSQKSKELAVSDNDLIIIFTVSISIVLGIFLYLARNLILRKKGEYEKKDFESKKDRDYEKYHSDWTSDDIDFEKTNDDKTDDEQYRKSVRNSTLPNYYRILGVPQTASQAEIKNQFRRLAKEWHPDKSKSSFTEKRMAEINKAYEVLSNENRRKKYDKYLNVS